MSTLLAFETATEACSVALKTNGNIQEVLAIAPRRHSELILRQINDLLVKTNVLLSDLDAIAFGSGPGSFMGVRIAVAMAQSLGFALNKPLIAISTLQALAQAVYQETQQTHIIVSWDARMGEIYWGAYVLDENKMMQAVVPDQICKPEYFSLDQLTQHNTGHNTWYAAGNGWLNHQDRFNPTQLGHMKFSDTLIYPKASAILELAGFAFSNHEVISPLEAVPNYLRDEVAQKHKDIEC